MQTKRKDLLMKERCWVRLKKYAWYPVSAQKDCIWIQPFMKRLKYYKILTMSQQVLSNQNWLFDKKCIFQLYQKYLVGLLSGTWSESGPLKMGSGQRAAKVVKK